MRDHDIRDAWRAAANSGDSMVQALCALALDDGDTEELLRVLGEFGPEEGVDVRAWAREQLETMEE